MWNSIRKCRCSMNCNFFTTHKGLISCVSICNILIAFSFYMVAAGILGMFVSVWLLNSHAIIDFTRCTLMFLSTFPIFLIGLYYRWFKKYKIKESPEFTYKMCKDWYSLNPKRFIFDSDHLGFFYLVEGNPDYIDEDKEVCFPRHPFYWECGPLKDYTYLMPKTFLDYLRYNLFVEKIFFEKTYCKNKKEQIMQEKYKNEELLNVLNVVQSDINKVMRDSQDILNKEAEKLEKIRNEQLS